MGTWRNAMVALGLANEVDDEYYEDERLSHDEAAAPSRRTERGPEPAPEREAQVTPIRQHSNVVAMAPAVEESMHRITTIHPRSYNDAKAIGESFRDGVPVIMNLSDMQDGDAKRMVDFSAGLVFGLRGTIERVTSKVFLLSPEFVQVDGDTSADEGSFYNQSSSSLVQIVAGVLYLAVLLYLLLLISRLVLEWIQSYAREYRPSGLVLVLFEVVYTLTDPPVLALRRLIPPLRIGAVALDLSLMILLVLGWILLSVLGGLAM